MITVYPTEHSGQHPPGRQITEGDARRQLAGQRLRVAAHVRLSLVGRFGIPGRMTVVMDTAHLRRNGEVYISSAHKHTI